MNKKIIYITEPEEIELNGEAKLLKNAGYKIVFGDKTVASNYTEDIDTLLIRSYTKIEDGVLSKLPNLKNIVRVGVGTDHIDLNLCKEKGVSVFNSAGANSNAVSEYVVCQVLTVMRKTHLLNSKDLETWNRYKYMGQELTTQVVGLVGFGNIAKLVYKKLSAFDCKKFLVYDPYVDPKSFSADNLEFCSLEYLLKNSNIISLHLPLTPETFHLINEKNLKKLKKGTLLINTSRGAIVSEEDIIPFLEKGDIFYISDVFETEPQVKSELLKQQNFIGSPHIASMTQEANRQMVTLAVNNLLEGKCMRI